MTRAVTVAESFNNIVAVGAIIPASSSTVPAGYLACNGAEYLRTSYASLFAYISFTDATCDTNSNTTVTMDSTALIGVGFGVSGAGIAGETTVASVTNATTLELSKAATATATNVTLTFMRWGVGTSDAKFRVPNFQGAFLRGTGTGTMNSRSKAGELVGVFQEDQFETHYHSGGNVNYGQNHWVSGIDFAGGSQSLWFDTSNPDNGRFGSETYPYSASVQYCIKY